MVGGNVSFYNETLGQAILPTPVIGMAGLLDDAEARATQWFETSGDRVALLGPEDVSLGGSEYLWVIHRRVAGRLAPLDLGLERAVQEACRAAIGARLLRSAHDCAEGGLAVALAEACVSGPRPVGAEIELAFGVAAPAGALRRGAVAHRGVGAGARERRTSSGSWVSSPCRGAGSGGWAAIDW